MKLMTLAAAVMTLIIFPHAKADKHKKKHHGSHKHHHAHSHGEAKLNLASENNSVDIEFVAPAESIIGFEHKAKTAADKEKVSKVEAVFNNQASELFRFPTELGCNVKKIAIKHAGTKHEHKAQSDHSDFAVTYLFTCKKPLKGSKVSINIQSFFKKITLIKIQALTDSGQKGMTSKKSGDTIDL